MEPDAEQKQQRRRIQGGGGIPEDVVTLILSRLPFKSIGRFKTVSKSWHQLIRSLHPFLLGLFYEVYSRTYRRRPVKYKHPNGNGIFKYIVGNGGGSTNNNNNNIGSTLSFLPITDKRVLDCCNGLLLLYQPHCNDLKYYICNPLTKSWTQLSRGLNWEFSRIDFNPNVSPYFKIVTLDRPQLGSESLLKIQVLSSDTPTMSWKRYKPVKFRDPSVHDQSYFMMIDYQHHALWEGSLYLSFGRINRVDFGDAGTIMRFDLLDNHVADRQLIELPKGTEKPKRIGIGRLRNKLCLAGLDWINFNNHPHDQMVPRLRVWSLSKRDQAAWVMEHDNIITSSSHLLCPPAANELRDEESAYIGQFHPFLDTVFILCKDLVYAYDMENLSLNEVCHLGSREWEVLQASIFPFLPSLMDYSIQWKTTDRRETSHCQSMRKQTSSTHRRR